MSGRLKLRRGVVVSADPLEVEVGGERRPAWADTTLVGEMREGDEVVVNVAAVDLGLGSGGFDVIHVNLTRGLDAEGPGGEHVMKLNYSSLQHPVDPVERPLDDPRYLGDGIGDRRTSGREGGPMPVLVLPLHGHLAAAAWAAVQGEPGAEGSSRIGYVQSAGGALPGALSTDVATLRERDLLCGHVTAGPVYGGEHEAISVAGALDAAVSELGWDAAIVAPGPGIIGSETRLGHGGITALDSAHAALALGMRTLLAPRLSSADPRERHRPVSHHTLTVMAMLLGPVEVPVPANEPVPTAVLAEACGWRHRLHEVAPDLEGFAASGLPARTMGRGIEEDPLFFAAARAAGAALRGKG